MIPPDVYLFQSPDEDLFVALNQKIMRAIPVTDAGFELDAMSLIIGGEHGYLAIGSDWVVIVGWSSLTHKVEVLVAGFSDKAKDYV
jgi:hypothetical protein